MHVQLAKRPVLMTPKSMEASSFEAAAALPTTTICPAALPSLLPFQSPQQRRHQMPLSLFQLISIQPSRALVWYNAKVSTAIRKMLATSPQN